MTGAKPPLNRADMMEAVADGIWQGIVELGTSHRHVPHELLYDAIGQGVKDAIWNIAPRATGMPCHDFYDSIKEGVRDATKQMHIKD
jgi:hypothetical protein